MYVNFTCFLNICKHTVFPTNRLYLGGPPKYIYGRPSIFGDNWCTFWFLLLLLSSHTFFIHPRKWNHLRSINYWKISPRPTRFVRLVLRAQGLLTLPQTTSSVTHTLIYLWRAALISTALCHQLPRDKRDFSTIFSNFQTLLVAFFPQQVHTDKPSEFFEKKKLMLICSVCH